MLDLKHGYHQMPLHPDSRPCTAMSTPLGPMQWKVVPMGAKNGNAAFQCMMEDLLGPVRDCADPFVDDIIIGSGTEDMSEDELIEAHEKDLRRVLSELDKHNMVCKPTKASLFVKEVEFAGHVVGHGQRGLMPGKLASLHHWEKPQTISELRSFMGFCNYYSGYVRMYAELSGPLHIMLFWALIGHIPPSLDLHIYISLWYTYLDRSMTFSLSLIPLVHVVDQEKTEYGGGHRL